METFDSTVHTLTHIKKVNEFLLKITKLLLDRAIIHDQSKLYENNSYRPEYHLFGVNNMTLIDVVEMYCDWLAISQKKEKGNMEKHIEINQERFSICPQLVEILKNTYDEFGSTLISKYHK